MGCAAAYCFDGAPAQQTDRRGGETVLLLHGSAGSGALWRHATKALAPLYRCLAPDLIGYGRSPPWSAGGRLTLDDERNALKPLLACCAETYHVVGYSYGGVLALQMALADRQRVRTLTLIEPVFFNALRDASAFSQFVCLSKDFETALQQSGAETAIRPFMDFWTGSGSWDRLPLFVRAEMLKSVRKIALDWQAAFAFAPDRQNLAALGPRTLLVRGTESPRPMLELVDALHALMPGSTRLTIEGANHLLPLTHADALTNSILSHLHADAERRLK
jgi:pimeloyl-ACP methyl ester carboxylesterase